MVLGLALAPLLWHGGYRPPAQVALACVAAVGLIVCRGALRPAPLILGLSLAAVSDAASLAWHHDRGSVAPVLAAIALPCLTAIAARARSWLVVELPLAVALLGSAIATSGLAGLALHLHPLAERIAGVWRAQGTLEYPPALGLICVCALAATLALHASGTLDRTGTVVLGALLTGTAVATFDRVAWIETAAVLALFGVRIVAVRRTAALIVGAAIACAVAAVVVSHPSRVALERHLRHGPISSRTGVWHDAWDAFTDRPLLGYGPGRFTAIYAGHAPAARIGLAHDAVLEQAVEAGALAAVGTAIALAAMLVAGAGALGSREPARLSAGLAASAVALSGGYDFTWSFAPLVVLGAMSAVACAGRTA